MNLSSSEITTIYRYRCFECGFIKEFADRGAAEKYKQMHDGCSRRTPLGWVHP